MRQSIEWQDEMNVIAKDDPWCKECLRICQEREKAYLAICTGWTDTEREIVDFYIAACEELIYSFAFAAYAAGAKKRSLSVAGK